MGIDAGSIYSEIRIRLDKLKGDIKGVETEFDKFNKNNDKEQGKFKKKWTDAFKNMNLAGVAAFAGLGLAVRKAINIYSDFEQSLANVQSVAGATPEEFKKLEEAALSAGQTTRFSASQAAEAMYSLASAGFDTTQSINALDGVLQLAGATGADLASTAATMTATLSQYGMEADEAGKVSNVFAAAIANSQANMEKLSSAFRQVGPVAAGLNISLEETTGALQALFDAGFQGAQAGTALRNVLGELASASSPAVTKLQELGLVYEDLNPATNEMASIIGTLADAGLNAGQVMEVFGKQAGPQMLTLIRAGESGIRDYTAAVTDTTAAADMYETQNDTLAGSIDMAKSAIESLIITFTKELAPALKSAVDFLTGLIKIVTGAPKPVRLFVGVLSVAIPVIGGVTLAVMKLGGALAVLAGPVGIVAAGIAGVVAVASTLARAKHEADVKRIEREYSNLKEELGLTVKEIKEFEKTAKQIGGTVEDVAMLSEKFGLTADQIKKASERAVIFANVVERGLSPVTGSVASDMQRIADQLGITSQQAIQVALNSGKITGEYKEQLIQLQQQREQRDSQIQSEEEWLDFEKRMREESIEAQRQRAGNDDASMRSRALAADEAERELEAQRQIEALRRADVINARRIALDETRAALEILQRQEEDGFISSEQFQKQRLSLYENEIQALYDAGFQIGQVDQATGNLSIGAQRLDYLIGEVRGTTEGLAEDFDDVTDSTDEAEKAVSEYTRRIAELGKSTEELREIERQRAISLVDGNEEAIALINEYYDALRDDTAYKERLANEEKLASETQRLGMEMMGAIMKLSAVTTEKRLRDIDRELEASLRAAGLAEDTKIQSLQKQLDKARESGDEETANEISQQIARQKIIEEAEKEKAQVQYEAALSQWRMNRATAIAEGALAILKSASALPFPLNVPLVAGTSGITGLNIAAVQKAKPDPPSFQTGGIVPGRSFRGDKVDAKLNSREMVLTQAQQRQLFDMANGGNRGGGDIVVNLNTSLNTDSQKNLEIAARALYPYLEREGARRG